jgi:hypothetical protein
MFEIPTSTTHEPINANSTNTTMSTMGTTFDFLAGGA